MVAGKKEKLFSFLNEWCGHQAKENCEIFKCMRLNGAPILSSGKIKIYLIIVNSKKQV